MAAGPSAVTEAGVVRGERRRGVIAFKGIPYAAPPVGGLRFRPPQPVDAWAGERDALEYGPVCAQAADPLERYAFEPDMLLRSDAVGSEVPVFLSEDCLYLNVWTPGVDEAARPVMVFIHGGACVVGSSSNDFYTGEHLAARGVVVVTFNYRLGVFGFLELGAVRAGYRGSGNNGLRDQVAALEWVRRNIAAFGGDPSNVTVFGESAGSISICALLATREPSRLFDRVIAQSGGPNLVHAATFQSRAAEAVLDAASRVAAEDVFTASSADLVHAGLVATLESELGDTLFAPYIDGELVIGEPYELLGEGHAAGIAMMAGATQDEMGYWSMYDRQLRNCFAEHTDAGPPAPVVPRRARAQLDAELAPSTLDDVYAEWLTSSDPPRGLRDDATTILLTQAHDCVMILPMTRLAEAQVSHAPTYLYRFGWKVPRSLLASSRQDVGAIHALELPFVFGTLDLDTAVPGGKAVLDDADQRLHAEQLAAAMSSAWTSFARTGDPNADDLPSWPGYDLDARPTLVWSNTVDGAIDSRTVSDPDRTRRETWRSWSFPPLA